MNPLKVPRLYQYGQKANTHDLLKAIAILLMIIDHIGYYFYPEKLWFPLIGRGAAPIFYFLVGYTGKVNCRFSLLVYGCILSVSTALLITHTFWINILYTFVMASLLIQYFPAKSTQHSAKVLIFVSLAMLHLILFRYIEYGTSGILIALTANWHIHKARHSAIWLAMSLAFHFIWQAVTFPFIADVNLIFSLVSIGCLYWIAFNIYQLKTLPCPKPIRITILALSRYSLEIYFYHLILFQIISMIYLRR
tara:strand:+ start:19708 stop:20457 length:750 start_codon:yes stop_codon:yes gene_type:complete